MTSLFGRFTPFRERMRDCSKLLGIILQKDDLGFENCNLSLLRFYLQFIDPIGTANTDWIVGKCTDRVRVRSIAMIIRLLTRVTIFYHVFNIKFLNRFNNYLINYFLVKKFGFTLIFMAILIEVFLIYLSHKWAFFVYSLI